MDFTLYFCNDGILRAYLSEKEPLIPLKFLQDNSYLKNNDFKFWTNWWTQPTYFEENLTVAQFLQCLEPWQDFFSDLTRKDIKSYIKEANIQKEEEKSFDWIGLLFYTEGNLETEIHKDDDVDFEDENFDITKWFNSPKNKRLTGNWNIHTHYQLTGFKFDEEEHYAIEGIPLYKIANTPLILGTQNLITLNAFQHKKILNSDWIKDKPYGFCKYSDNYFFLISDKHHSFRDVLEGFFYWMSYSPKTRDKENERISKAVSKIKSVEQNDVEFEDNIIPLFEEFENKTNNQNKEVKEVKIADGAFDSMIEQHSKSQIYWHNMIELAKQNKTILKIGKLTLAKEPEDRIYNKIISKHPELKETPTDFKKT